jgi:hypothetical protein
MPLAFTLPFLSEVVDRQQLLNGATLFCIEGRASQGGRDWQLVLNYARPKEPRAEIEEADLTLETEDGTIVAGLDSGQAMLAAGDAEGEEQDTLELVFRIDDGEGAFQTAEGDLHIRLEMSSNAFALEVQLRLD